MRRFTIVFPLILLLTSSSTVFAARLSSNPPPAKLTGEIIIELAKAIENQKPTDADLQVIIKHGTDSRFYLLVRGWLEQYLKIINSQLSLRLPEYRLQPLKDRQEFLKKAIKRIDLE